MPDMGDRIRTARDQMSRHLMTSMYFGQDGELRLLLSIVNPDKPSEPAATVGSALLRDHAAIEALVRGWECGYASALGDH